MKQLVKFILMGFLLFPMVGQETKGNHYIVYYDTTNDGIGNLKVFYKITKLNNKITITEIKRENTNLKPIVRR